MFTWRAFALNALATCMYFQADAVPRELCLEPRQPLAARPLGLRRDHFTPNLDDAGTVALGVTRRAVGRQLPNGQPEPFAQTARTASCSARS